MNELEEIFKINESGDAIIELWSTQIYLKITGEKGFYKTYSNNKIDDIKKAIKYINDELLIKEIKNT